MKALLLSSSRVGNSNYLEQARPHILEHLDGINEITFVPYAGVSISWDEYTQKVQEALPELNISNIHNNPNPAEAAANAKAFLVGGGNTFNLLNCLYQFSLIEVIKARVKQGIPYIGWSAGSNIAGVSIKTTNDMPIVQPPSFDSFGFVNAQINPHYTDYVAPGHNGETRDMRIQEFCILEKSTSVIGIQEGSALQIKDRNIRLVGDLDAVEFLGLNKTNLAPGADLSRFLELGTSTGTK